MNEKPPAERRINCCYTCNASSYKWNYKSRGKTSTKSCELVIFRAVWYLWRSLRLVIERRTGIKPYITRRGELIAIYDEWLTNWEKIVCDLLYNVRRGIWARVSAYINTTSPVSTNTLNVNRNYVSVRTLTDEKVLIPFAQLPTAHYISMNLLSSRETRLFAGHVLPDVFQRLENLFAPETTRHIS